MRYLGASVAVLVAAMTFSLTTLGQAARASEDKPAVGSLLDRNAIVALSASSSTTIPYNIERYMNPPKRLEGWLSIIPPHVQRYLRAHGPPHLTKLVGKTQVGTY